MDAQQLASPRYYTALIHCVHSFPHQIQIVQRRNNGEKKCCAQKAYAGGPYPSDMVELPQHHKNHSRDLSEGVGFTENAGTKIAQSRDGIEHSAHCKNANIPAENHHRELPGNLVNDGKNQERRAEQHLIGNGIEILSEQRLLMKGAGQQSVQPITKPCEEKQDECAAIVSLDQLYYHEWQECHAHQRELIGRGEYLRKPDPSFRRRSFGGMYGGGHQEIVAGSDGTWQLK